MTGPLPKSHLQSSDVNQAYVRRTFPPQSEVPFEFIFWRLPNVSAYEVSPRGHPYTLLLHGSTQNLTGDTLTGTSTFLARRQQHVLFTSTVDLEFVPGVVGEEAGISIYLNQAQHFDLGIVALEPSSRYIRLRTFTPNSTSGDSDPISSPGMFKLPNLDDKLTLKVQAVNASTYKFSYATESKGKWQTVGYGNANEVSGGYTGVSISCFCQAWLLTPVVW